MVKSFMTTRSISWGVEVDEAPIEGDTTPFLKEDAIMMILRRHPSLEKNRGLDPSMQTPYCSNLGWGDAKMYGHDFFLYISMCKYIYIYIYIFVHRIHTIKIKGKGTIGEVALGCKDAG
jgi:hypothetical protein